MVFCLRRDAKHRGDLDEHLRKLIIQSQNMQFVASGEGVGSGAGAGGGYHGGYDGVQAAAGSLPQAAPISPPRSLPQQRPPLSTSPGVPPRNGANRGGGKQVHAHTLRPSPGRSSRGAGRPAGAAAPAGAGGGGGNLEASQGSRGHDSRWNKKQQSGSASNPNPPKSGSGVSGSATGQRLKRHYSAGRGDARRGQGQGQSQGQGRGQLRRHQSQRRSETGGAGANAGAGAGAGGAANRVVSDDRLAAANPSSSGNTPGATGTGAGGVAGTDAFGGDVPSLPLVKRASSERKCGVSKKDGDHLRNGFVSRTALEALLDPVESWDPQAKQIVIDLLQVCVVWCGERRETSDERWGWPLPCRQMVSCVMS